MHLSTRKGKIGFSHRRQNGHRTISKQSTYNIVHYYRTISKQLNIPKIPDFCAKKRQARCKTSYR